MLAQYGAERGETLQRHTPARHEHAELAALVHRRIDLVEARKIERTRAKAPRASLVEDTFARAIAFLNEEIARIDAAIKALFAVAKDLAARKVVLETIPGIAHTVASTLIALMPEFGSASRRFAGSRRTSSKGQWHIPSGAKDNRRAQNAQAHSLHRRSDSHQGRQYPRQLLQKTRRQRKVQAPCTRRRYAQNHRHRKRKTRSRQLT